MTSEKKEQIDECNLIISEFNYFMEINKNPYKDILKTKDKITIFLNNYNNIYYKCLDKILDILIQLKSNNNLEYPHILKNIQNYFNKDLSEKNKIKNKIKNEILDILNNNFEYSDIVKNIQNYFDKDLFQNNKIQDKIKELKYNIYEIDIKDVIINNFLGSGRHGLIYDCKYNNQDFVIKLFCSENEEELEIYRNICDIMSSNDNLHSITSLKYYGFRKLSNKKDNKNDNKKDNKKDEILNNDDPYANFKKKFLEPYEIKKKDRYDSRLVDHNQTLQDCLTNNNITFFLMEKIDLSLNQYIDNELKYKQKFPIYNLFELYLVIYNLLLNGIEPIDLHGGNIGFKKLEKDKIYNVFYNNNKEYTIIIPKGKYSVKLVDFGMYKHTKYDYKNIYSLTGNDIYRVLMIIFRQFIFYNVQDDVIFKYLNTKESREKYAFENIIYISKHINNTSQTLKNDLNIHNVFIKQENNKKNLEYSDNFEYTNHEITDTLINEKEYQVAYSYIKDYNKIYPKLLDKTISKDIIEYYSEIYFNLINYSWKFVLDENERKKYRKIDEQIKNNKLKDEKKVYSLELPDDD